jgi:NodT family efflux transporter outer membrane factor (OMF) lipoprotein
MKYPVIFLIILFCSSCLPFSQTMRKPTLPDVPGAWNVAEISAAEPSFRLDSFADPRLVDLFEEALQGNFSLRAAAARVVAAQARAEQAGADLLPAAGLDFDAVRRRTAGSVNNSFAFGAGGSWEVDLWQRLTATEQAALSDARAFAADYQAAQLSLAAAVARSWFRFNEAELQRQLAEQIVNSYLQSLQVIEEQYRRGLTSALDLRLARTAVNNAEAALAERTNQQAVEQRLLEQLLGRYPAGRISASSGLPQLATTVPAGLPSSLLERRPDIRAAGLRLQAEQLRAASAERNWLPDFRLTASAGTASDRLYQLLDWDDLVWSLAASLTQTLFDGGEQRAARQLAKAELDQQLAEYAELALTAFREVEETLSAEINLRRQAEMLQLAVIEAKEARQLAEERYRQGLEGIITLLETQRRAFTARSNLLRVSRLQLENRVNLHLALGGSLAEEDSKVQKMETP